MEDAKKKEKQNKKLPLLKKWENKFFILNIYNNKTCTIIIILNHCNLESGKRIFCTKNNKIIILFQSCFWGLLFVFAIGLD